MRSNLIVRISTLAFALSLLLSGAVNAQSGQDSGLGELETPPPPQFQGVRTALVMNGLLEPAIAQIVEPAARDAHVAIGGLRKRFRVETLPDRRSTANAARNLAAMNFDLVVVSGGDPQVTVGSAGLDGNTTFIDIDQSRPCVTVDGFPDPSGACAGGATSLPFNYSAVDFASDQGAYLAGIVAASASRTGRLGIIIGYEGCKECMRVAEAFTLGAQSVRPAIRITRGVLAQDGQEAVTADPTTAKTFAEAFINVYQPDVLLPVAGAGSVGMIEAACDAGILAIGTDIDVTSTYPNVSDCILLSVTKDYAKAVHDSIFAVASGTLQNEQLLGLRRGGVTVTDEWRRLPGLPVDLPSRYDSARASIEAGLVDTCPTQCPTRERPVAPSPSPSPSSTPSG